MLTIVGELDMHGRQQPVTLWGLVHELGPTADGRRRVRVRASTELHWRRWGIRGLPLIGDALAITLDIEALEAIHGSGYFHARGVDLTGAARRAVRKPRVANRPI